MAASADFPPEGSVEEISDQVSQGISELGIVYVAQKQVPAFRHILSHKKLSFQELDVKPACVYVGPNHPRYEDESIDFTELPQLKFVSGIRDFFLNGASFKPCEPGSDQHGYAEYGCTYQ